MTGRVADGGDGAPLARVRVELWPDLAPLALDRLILDGRLRPEPAAATTTGRDGGFRLAAPEPGFWLLRLEAPGRLPLEVPLAPLFEPLDLADLELPPAGELTLTVTAEDGAPLAGALVVAVAAAAEQGPRRPPLRSLPVARPAARLAFTGDDGRATVPRAAGEALEIEVLPPGRPVLAVRVAADARAAGLALRAPAGTPRLVRVLDLRGQAAAGAVVEVGRFGLPAARVDADGLATVTVPVDGGSVEVLGDGGTRANGELVTPDPAAGAPKPVELRLLPPLEIAGRVLAGDSGDPLPGALLWALGADHRRTVAGARGEFRLAVDLRSLRAGPGTRVLVGAAAPGYLLAMQPLQLPVDGGEVPVRLTPAVRLAGRVLDRDGQPVAGAEVAAWPAIGRGFMPRTGNTLEEVRSGEDGRFVLERLQPEGGYVLKVDHPGFGPLEVPTVVPAVGTAAPPLELVLPPAVTVRGRVLDAAEAPVPGARVVLRGAEATARSGMPLLHRVRRLDEGEPSATTGADGRFVLPGLGAGRYDVDAEAAGYTPLRVPGVEVPEEAEVDLGTLYLVPGAVLEGRVVGPDGRPLEGVEVAVQQDDRVERRPWREDRAPKPRRVTGADGRFRADGLTTGVPATVTADRDGYAQRVLQAVPVPGEEPLEIELLPAGRIYGQVVGPGGTGVPHASVIAHGLPGPQRQVFGGEMATAGDDGRFVLAEVPPGEVVLSVRAAGFVAREMPALRLAPGEERSGLRLVLQRASVVSGRVTGPGGEPVEGAHVRLETSHRSPGAATDADGRFRLDEVPPGAVAVRVEHRAYLGATRELEVAPGGEHRLDVTLERGGEVAGRVLDAAGAPAAGAWVQLVSAEGRRGFGGWSGRDGTAADGSFRIVGVEPGRYRVLATLAGHATAESDELEVVAGAPGPAVELRLEAGAAITGRVLGVELADLARVELRAVPGEGGRGGGIAGVVSYDGTYRVEGVAPGQWQVIAQLGQSQAAVVEPVEVAPGQVEVQRDVDLGAGHTLSGRVTLDGEPLAGATLMVMGLDRSRGAHATTDPAGRYEVRGLPAGTYALSLSSAASVSDRREVELAGDREVDLDLVSGGIEGTVTDAATGAAVDDAEVTLVRRDETSLTTAGSRRVDSGGGFRFEPVPAGRYEVRARSPDYVAATAEVEVAPGATSRADLRLDPGEGLVLAITTSGRALRGFAHLAAFDAAALDAAAAGSAGPVAPVAQEAVPPGSGGRARLRLPAGRWRLLITARGYAIITVDAAVPGPPVTVALGPGGDLSIRVPALAEGFERGEVRLRGSDGRLLLAPDGNGRAVAARILNFGRVALAGVPPGTWTVEASAPDGRTWTAVTSVEPGTRSELVLE